MSKSDDRFYLLEFRHRPAMLGDIGSLLRLEGVVIGGGGAREILLLPGSEPMKAETMGYFVHELSIEDWSDWLRRSDNPEILVGPSANGSNATLPKIWHRKLRYEISGAVQQKIWSADNFQCAYCGAQMGRVLMTIDHFQPLELGGKNDVTNYLTACKPCNKSKGSQDPKEWLAQRPSAVRSFDALRNYLANRKI
jgi:hypothetical protein